MCFLFLIITIIILEGKLFISPNGHIVLSRTINIRSGHKYVFFDKRPGRPGRPKKRKNKGIMKHIFRGRG